MSKTAEKDEDAAQINTEDLKNMCETAEKDEDH
jgi:hypothetical protein